MKKKITATYMHELLKDAFLKGDGVMTEAELTRVPQMSDDERRELNVRLLNWMIGRQPCADTLGWYIGQFVTDDGKPRKDNPLYEEEGTPLTDWYLELVSLGYDLYTHRPFDLDLIMPGLAHDKITPEFDFTIDNAPLCDWLTQTPYRFLAMLVARIMYDVEFDKVAGNNDAVQDYYAEHCPLNDFYTNDLKEANGIIQLLLDGLTEIRSHREKGQQLGLDAEQMRVVDLLWSWVPHDYPEEYVKAAKEIIKAADKSLPGKTVIRSRKGFLEYRKQLTPKLVKIVEKYDLPVDLTDRYNLTMGYMNEWLYSKYLGGVVLDEYA